MSADVHSNKLRSHLQHEIEDERKVAIGIIGKELMEKDEAELMEKIVERVPRDDKTKREFDIRWVLSCYCVYSEIKPAKVKEPLKKVPKTNGKEKKVKVGKKIEVPSDVLMQEYDKKGNPVNGAGKKAEAKKTMGKNVSKAVKEDAAKKAALMDIKENRPVSTNLVAADTLNSEENVVAETM